jgi:hypothetical protein
MRGHSHLRRGLIALAPPLIAVALVFLVPAAQASKHRYPSGTVKLPSSAIKHVSGIACGKTGAQWLPGKLFSSHWFLSFARYSKDYKALARHAHGSARRHDLKLAKSYAKKAKTDLPICNQVVPPTPPPSYTQPAPSIFGINASTYDTVSSNYTKDEPAAKALGSRWDLRVLGPATATGNFSSPDYWVKQATSRGMGIVLSFTGIQSACSIPNASVASCPPTTASDLTNYQNYIEQVLGRYHSQVEYYESWKEPNHASQWGGTAANPAQYAALLKAQYQAFQTFNTQHPNSGPGGSNMKLLFGSANGFTTIPPSNDMAALPWVEQVLDDLNGAQAFDGVALHAYRYPADAGPDTPVTDYVGGVKNLPSACQAGSTGCALTWSQELQAYEQEFTAHGYGQPPMWLTEFGWPGGGDLTDAYCTSNQGYCQDTAAQDADLKAAYRVLLGLPFVQGALWFNLRDYAPGAGTGDPEEFHHMGLLNYDYSHKSAADDFSTLAAANPNR